MLLLRRPDAGRHGPFHTTRTHVHVWLRRQVGHAPGRLGAIIQCDVQTLAAWTWAGQTHTVSCWALLVTGLFRSALGVVVARGFVYWELKVSMSRKQTLVNQWSCQATTDRVVGSRFVSAHHSGRGHSTAGIGVQWLARAGYDVACAEWSATSSSLLSFLLLWGGSTDLSQLFAARARTAQRGTHMQKCAALCVRPSAPSLTRTPCAFAPHRSFSVLAPLNPDNN